MRQETRHENNQESGESALKKNSSQREIIKNYFVNKKLKETPRNIQEKIINKIKAIK